MSLEDKCWDAFKYRDHEEAVRLLPLVKEPNKIKRRDYIRRDNTSLLHLSSRNGWLDVTKDLITKYHCDPKATDSDNRTILHEAASRNSPDVIKYLINEWNHDPMAVDSYRRTPLHCALLLFVVVLQLLNIYYQLVNVIHWLKTMMGTHHLN